MNWDQVAGNWKQLKGAVKEKWGKLTDDDLDVVAGKSDQLVGKIQERYGITKEEAEKEFKKPLEVNERPWQRSVHVQGPLGVGRPNLSGYD